MEYNRKYKGICDFCGKEAELDLRCPKCGLSGKEIENPDLHDKICDECIDIYLKARNESANYVPPHKTKDRYPKRQL